MGGVLLCHANGMKNHSIARVRYIHPINVMGKGWPYCKTKNDHEAHGVDFFNREPSMDKDNDEDEDEYPY
jgi:hypothetical protein